MQGTACTEDIMDNLLDKLVLLRYEVSFAAKRKMLLLHRMYFAHRAPTADASEQLIYFSNLVQWLLGLAHKECSLSGSFADPQQLRSAIVGDVCKAGVLDQQITEADIHPGWGRAVCTILSRLADAALEREPAAWERPVHRAGMPTEHVVPNTTAELNPGEWPWLKGEEGGTGGLAATPSEDGDSLKAAGPGRSDDTTSNAKLHKQDLGAAQEHVACLKAKLAAQEDCVKTLEDALHQVSAELACRKAELAKCSSIADGSAGEKMLEAICELQQEMRHMDVLTGVLQDQLWKARMHSSAGRGLA